MEIFNNIVLNMQAPAYATVYSPQGQTLSRSINAKLLDGATDWTIPTGATMVIRYAKPDGTIGWYDTLEDGTSAYSFSSSIVTFGLAAQALSVPGTVNMQLDFYSSDAEHLSTFTFRLEVVEGVFADNVITSSDYFNVLTAKLAEATQIFQEIKAGYGAPLTANTSSAMTDTNRVYVYTGTTGGGFTNGHWYYWNGSAWTDGGVYNAIALETDKTLSIAGMAADAKAAGDDIGILAYTLSSALAETFKITAVPSNMSVDGSGKIFLSGGYVNSSTGATSSSTSGKYLRTQAGSDGANTFLMIGDKTIVATLGLDWIEWNCWSYSGTTNASATHSNTNQKYIPGSEPIIIPANATDKRMCFAFRIPADSDANRPVISADQIEALKDNFKFFVLTDSTLTTLGAAADAAAVGSAVYGTKNRSYHSPAQITWWEVPSSFTSSNPVYPSDVPINSYTFQYGSLLAGFAEKGVPISTTNRVYYLFCYCSMHNSSIRFYEIYNATYSEHYIATTTDGGTTITLYNSSLRRPSAKILWLGDSISRGRIGGESANYQYGIPWYVARDNNCICENFGIGNIGWCAGWTSSSPNKTNAIGYLKRVGNPDYYDASDSWSGYKFLGSGNWEDFNTIVLALGTNDGAYPLGSLDDIDDTLSYAEVMAWKTSAQDSDATNRTIVKAIYQCYRYIRESEAYHDEGEPYVAGGSSINIIFSDPIISGGSGDTPPAWGYDRVRSGGYTRLQLNELLKAFAEKYGCGHISNYDAPIDRLHLYNSIPDGVHPNQITYQQLGRHFAGKVSALIR